MLKLWSRVHLRAQHCFCFASSINDIAAVATVKTGPGKAIPENFPGIPLHRTPVGDVTSSDRVTQSWKFQMIVFPTEFYFLLRFLRSAVFWRGMSGGVCNKVIQHGHRPKWKGSPAGSRRYVCSTVLRGWTVFELFLYMSAAFLIKNGHIERRQTY